MPSLVKVQGWSYPDPNSPGKWAYYVRLLFFDGTAYNYQAKFGFETKETAEIALEQEVMIVKAHVELILLKDDEQKKQTALLH